MSPSRLECQCCKEEIELSGVHEDLVLEGEECRELVARVLSQAQERHTTTCTFYGNQESLFSLDSAFLFREC